MLKSLSVKNIVLIKDIRISFTKGLCIFTGETGGGKSILLDAMGLVLGNKANIDLIRHGEDKGTVIGVFKSNKFVNNILQEMDIEHDEDIIIRRIIDTKGKSKAYINDSPISNKTLKTIASYLVEIHGQYTQQALLETTEHIKMLDEFAEVDLTDLKNTYKNWKDLTAKLHDMETKIEDAKKEEEYLQHVLKELDEIAAEENEEDELQIKRMDLKNSSSDIKSIKNVVSILNEAASFSTAQNVLIKSGNPKFGEIIESLERARIEAEEASYNLEKLLSDYEYNPYSLEQIEDRLFALKDIARKYRVQVNELPAYRDKVAAGLDLINKSEEDISELKEKIQSVYEDYLKLANELSDKRKKAAKKLEDSIKNELPALKMDKARFEVDISACDARADGMDAVEFMISTNAGLPLSPLSKVASGGEISRFMLALKVILSSKADKFHSLVFDEIDSGIGGATASAVGKRLHQLAANSQVLVVTHQPQVAAYANQHFIISKKDNTTRVTKISDCERKEELARMLSGENITEEARVAAESLMRISV